MGGVDDVIEVLTDNPGSNAIFYGDALIDYGAYYPLDEYEKFSEIYLDKYKAERFFDKDITKYTDNKLDKHSWVPSAEVAMRMVKKGTVVYPYGREIHDDRGYPAKPNIGAANAPDLFNQTYALQGNIEWAKSCIHLHPISARKYTGETFSSTQEYSWKFKGKPDRFITSSGPSDEDYKLLDPIDPQYQDLLNTIRWVVIDRKVLYLYRYDRFCMNIERHRPEGVPNHLKK